MDRCPGCGSDNIYFSKKRQVYVCEDCELEFAEERPEIQSKTIFFSYAHDENEWLVQKLKGDIEQRGHKVWIDRSEIKSGDDWRQSITEGLLSSSGVLMIPHPEYLFFMVGLESVKAHLQHIKSTIILMLCVGFSVNGIKIVKESQETLLKTFLLN